MDLNRIGASPNGSDLAGRRPSVPLVAGAGLALLVRAVPGALSQRDTAGFAISS
jgi:hypothetical protein